MDSTTPVNLNYKKKTKLSKIKLIKSKQERLNTY